MKPVRNRMNSGLKRRRSAKSAGKILAQPKQGGHVYSIGPSVDGNEQSFELVFEKEAIYETPVYMRG
ncbi:MULTISPECIES: hypothetical protein [Paenibacillus]|uniref:Uncharacterized protein n=1 Tax=Paenibacillus lutrae TaxID=2078573 RepID=A0A7X3FEZ9_9BACL|nr:MULTISPECIES: hypothetical protein [Paenibacillus]MVO98420.1 hypothetical protein [Paenibacillus lutrae]